MFCREELRLFVRQELEKALENIIDRAECLDRANGEEKASYYSLRHALIEEFNHE